jgi:Fe2+ transport system protein B
MLGGYMAEISLDENKLKEILKTAIVEVIQERKEIFSDLLAEIIEDIALEKAIKEGENTESVSREAIFKIQDRQG